VVLYSIVAHNTSLAIMMLLGLVDAFMNLVGEDQLAEAIARSLVEQPWQSICDRLDLTLGRGVLSGCCGEEGRMIRVVSIS